MGIDDDREAGFNPQRRLCADGSCLGVMGADGKCTECGSEAAGEVDPGEEAPRAGGSLADDDVSSSDMEPAEARAEGPAFDPTRRLCSDDTCIGVIGSDDRCQLCGRPASS